MLQRFGVPDVSRHRRFVSSIGVDALGSGLFIPLSVLYFLVTTPLTITEVGLANSVASAVAVPAVLLIGHLVDQVGPKRILLVSNIVQTIGYVGYLFVQGYVSAQAVLVVEALGQSAFWSSYAPMVAAITQPGERETWYGFLGALRNLGFAVGGLVAGAAITVGTPAAYRTMVAVNAFSYVLAFALLLRVRTRAVRSAPGEAEQSEGGWSRIARDGSYHLLVAANLMYAVCCIALNYVMPVYAVEILHLPGWLSGAMFTVNTVMVGFGQSPVVRQMHGHVRWRIVALGNIGFASGFVLLAAAGHLPAAPAVGLMLVAVAIYSCGELLCGPVLRTVASDSRPARLRGRYMSVYQLSWSAAQIVAPVTLGWLMGHGRTAVWVALVAVAAAGVVLARLMAVYLPVAARAVSSRRPPLPVAPAQ